MVVNSGSRKGISALITTLLLIFTTIVSSAVTYTWVISMVDNQSTQTRTSVRIDNINWLINYSGEEDRIGITVRNTGSVTAVIESISISENKANSITYTNNYYTSLSVNNAVGYVDIGESIVLYMDTIQPEINKKDIITGWLSDPGKNTISYGKSYLIRINTNTVFFYESVVSSPPKQIFSDLSK